MKQALVPVVPPPLVFLACLALAIGLGWRWPLPLGRLSLAPVLLLALPLFGSALLIGAWSLVVLRRHRTSPEPWRVPSALVTTGPYGWSRNPLYVALLLVHLGLAVVLDSGWVLGTGLLLFLWLDRRTIAGEEAMLEREFSEDFRDYRARVRRWL